MRVIGGVDEAGLGPLLGPLCVGHAYFGLEGGSRSLRAALRGACAGSRAARRARNSRILVCDSKLLHRGRHKLARLERTALAFLGAAAGGRLPRDVGEVLGWDSSVRAQHPWYGDLREALPVAAERADVERAIECLLETCCQSGVRFLALGVRAIPEGDLNALFDRTGNKSLALFEATTPALARAAAFAANAPVVVCDRQGGRASYAPLLSRAYGGAWVRIVRQTRTESLYSVALPEGRVRVAFAVGGEGRSAACALASCLAKYSRELAMRSFNGYFRSLDAGTRATAGYATDGRRFLADIAPALGRAGIDPVLLTRKR